MPGNPDGPGPRADVVPPLPNALRNQAPPLGWNHTQGEYDLLFGVVIVLLASFPFFQLSLPNRIRTDPKASWD